jgi:hypothetical protein
MNPYTMLAIVIIFSIVSVVWIQKYTDKAINLRKKKAEEFVASIRKKMCTDQLTKERYTIIDATYTFYPGGVEFKIGVSDKDGNKKKLNLDEVALD